MKKHVIYWLVLGLIVIVGCQKELSIEGSNDPAEGSLQDDVSGDCSPKTVNGVYGTGVALVPATNNVVVQVNVTRTGTYVVGTDTVNGYYFRATGTFTTLGATNVTLRGNGTPFAAGVNNFVVSFDSTVCDLQVTVTTASAFTLVSGGTPANCASAVVTGTYLKDADLVPANNYVDITVNVTTIGAYSIRATGGGMTFQKTASFTATGNQVVRLDGTGRPTTVGANTITFDAPFAACSFTVTVGTPVTGTLGGGPGACLPITVNGTYTINVPLTASNTVQVQITTSAVGPYTVSTNTVAGISFSASGTSTGAPQTITLNGTGTPTASGTQNFTVTFGTSTCTFSIPIGAAPTSAWTPDCTTAFVDPEGLYETNLQLNCTNIVDIDVNVTAIGPYSITTTAVNGMTFSASGTFTMTGVQTIRLLGTGTPLVATTSNIQMPGTVPCTFPVTVDVPFGPIEWGFTVTNAPATTYKGQTDDAQLISNPPGAGFLLQGSNSISGDNLSIVLADANGTITNGETYSTSSVTGNSAAFQYDLGIFSTACSDTYKADPTVTGVSITFTVNVHNTATKTISGSFTGTAKNAAAGTITITSGSFTGTYL